MRTAPFPQTGQKAPELDLAQSAYHSTPFVPFCGTQPLVTRKARTAQIRHTLGVGTVVNFPQTCTPILCSLGDKDAKDDEHDNNEKEPTGRMHLAPSSYTPSAS